MEQVWYIELAWMVAKIMVGRLLKVGDSKERRVEREKKEEEEKWIRGQKLWNMHL